MMGLWEAYRVLGLGPDATPEEVKAAYRRQARLHHPDRGGDPEAFARVAAAWRTLSRPAPARAAAFRRAEPPGGAFDTIRTSDSRRRHPGPPGAAPRVEVVSRAATAEAIARWRARPRPTPTGFAGRRHRPPAPGPGTTEP